MENNSCIRAQANRNQIDSCKGTILNLNHSFEKLSSVLNIAGNTIRLKILFLLAREKELCVCDLSDILEMKIPAVSQHLRKMKDRNIIGSRRDAQTIYYSLTNEYLYLFDPFFNLLNDNKILKAV